MLRIFMLYNTLNTKQIALHKAVSSNPDVEPVRDIL